VGDALKHEHFRNSILFEKVGSCPMSAIATRAPESSQSGFLPIPVIRDAKIKSFASGERR